MALPLVLVMLIRLNGNKFPFVFPQSMMVRSDRVHRMLEVIGAAPGSRSDIDWHQTWRDSQEYEEVRKELDRLKAERPRTTESASKPHDKASYREFAAPLRVQFVQTTKRVFEQYWRTPSYIYSKTALCVIAVRFPNASATFFQNGRLIGTRLFS